MNDAAMRFWRRVGSSIFVDRFHWGNHLKTHAYCTENCNPDDNQRIVGANTETCEQSFRWFARHKYSLNHMSPARFRFFILLIAARRNEILLRKRAREIGDFVQLAPLAPRRVWMYYGTTAHQGTGMGPLGVGSPSLNARAKIAKNSLNSSNSLN